MGFTLVELLVALGIFLIVITIAMTSLLKLSSSNHIAQISRKALDNMDFVFDDITREARLGKNYHCGVDGDEKDGASKDCHDGATSFAFTRIDDGQIIRYKKETKNGFEVITKKIGSAAAQSLTAEGVNIPLLKFYVFGSGVADGYSARVLVTLQAELKQGERYVSRINLQTNIAQREQDN